MNAILWDKLAQEKCELLSQLFYRGPVTSDEQKDADCESTK